MRHSRSCALATFWVAACLASAASAQEAVQCPGGGGQPGPIYGIEVFEQVWCWPQVDGATVYRVETSTNDGPWMEEAVVYTNYVTLRRDLGDTVQVRLNACWDSTCTDFSEPGQKLWVLPDFDFDGSGTVGGPDFGLLLRSGQVGGPTFGQFLAVFGKTVVGQRYE
jgi:hypothetical protein